MKTFVGILLDVLFVLTVLAILSFALSYFVGLTLGVAVTFLSGLGAIMAASVLIVAVLFIVHVVDYIFS